MNKYLTILLFLSFIGCSDQASKEGSESMSQASDHNEQEQATPFALLITNVDQLRCRNYGDIKSGMVTTFDENTLLRFMNEETDYEETIGGHTGSWKRIQSLDGEYEGWVFGAKHFVDEWMSEEEMEDLLKRKQLEFFSNLNKNSLSELTGASLNESSRGSRFTGYYEYDHGSKKSVINGQLKVRARVLDPSTQEVKFISCEMEIKEGMPATKLMCQ